MIRHDESLDSPNGAPSAAWAGDKVIDRFSNYQTMRGMSPLTVRRRRMTLEAFARFVEPATLGDVDLSHIEEWLSTKPAVRTRHAYRSDLRVFYDWAVKRNMLTANPAVLVDSIKVPKALPRPIGAEVQAALLVGTLRARRAVALGLYAGLRCAEIAALDAGDVDFAGKVLIVRDGKGGKDRVLPLHPKLAHLLRGLPGSGRVFTHGGKSVESAAISRLITRQFDRCGIDATPHQLRHTFGTELARRAKGNLVAMAALMGHGSTETTKGYVGWSADMADVVAAMFSDEEDTAA
jgi:integrase